MAKRMIEIDVPDGMEPCDPITYTDQYGEISTTLIQFKKKEPAFIEVRECLYMSKIGNGVKMGIAQKGIDDITNKIISYDGLIKTGARCTYEIRLFIMVR